MRGSGACGGRCRWGDGCARSGVGYPDNRNGANVKHSWFQENDRGENVFLRVLRGRLDQVELRGDGPIGNVRSANGGFRAMEVRVCE